MTERTYDDECGDHGGNNGECGLAAGWGTDFDTGKCKFHRGTSPDGSSHDDNDFAAKAGAWADDFFEDFLTEEEQRRVKEAVDVLGDEAGAQEVGRFVAMLATEQFRRTGDERFLRRFESICDKFGITPADELSVDGELDVNGDVSAEFVTYESTNGDE
jgi:hypothetical protein